MEPTPLQYGGAPVPYTVSWSGEDAFCVARCAFTRRSAICQAEARGAGRPRFGKPHWQRQREAIAKDLCDLCGRPLKMRTKVSLSHARLRTIGAEGPCVMQVEPMLHKECAAESISRCPSLKRDIKAGTLVVRHVTRHRAQFAVADPEYVSLYVPGYVAKPSDRIVAHGKVELISWVERDAAWLERAA